jgi:hypothetical protein
MNNSRVHKNSEFGFRSLIENNTFEDLYLVHRSGVKTILPAKTSETLNRDPFMVNQLIIYGEVGVPDCVLTDVIDTKTGESPFLLEQLGNHLSEFKQEHPYCQHWATPWDRAFHTCHDINNNYFVSESLGVLVCKVPELDNVLAKSGFLPMYALHKEMPEPKLGDDMSIEDRNFSNSDILHATAVVIDKRNKIGTLWTTVFGQTYELPVITNSQLEDGVYLKSGSTGNGPFEFIAYNSTDFDKLIRERNIHRKRDDAIFDPSNKELAAKLTELSKLKAEHKKVKLELQELIIEHKKVKEKHKEEFDTLKGNRLNNTILDWFRAIMGPFGGDIKRLIGGLFTFA